MNEGRLKCILSGLRRYELTETERRFIRTVERTLNGGGMLTQNEEFILEELYEDKTTFIRDAIISMLQQSNNQAPVTSVMSNPSAK